MSANEKKEKSISDEHGKIPFEEAINRAGFGLYSYLLVALTCLIIISYVFVAYNNPIIIPTSACELETTGAQQGLLAAFPIVGTFVGAPPWGYIGDTRGRRTTLIISLISAGIANSLASLSVNWIMMLILQFLVTISAAGLFSLSMSLLSESVPLTQRNPVVLIVSSVFLLSQGIQAAVAIPIIPLSFSHYIPALGIYWNSWRTLMLIFSAPCVASVIGILFVCESPKYAYSKGQEEQALEILRRIHRINNFFGKDKKEFNVKGIIIEEQVDADKPQSKREQFAPLVKPPLLKYMIIMSVFFLFQQISALFVWFPTVANHIIQSVGHDAPTNQTICDVLRSSLDSPPEFDPDVVPCSLNNTTLWIVVAVASLQSFLSNFINLFLKSVGRRNMVIIISAICGISGILVNLIPNTIASAVFYVVLLMGIIVIGLYTAIAVALFPTNLKVFAMGLMMTGGRIGTIASVQILNYLLVHNCDAGFYIYATLFGSSAIVASFLPDDRKLPKQPTADLKAGENAIFIDD